MIKLACVHVRVHELFLFGFRIIPGSDLLLRSLDEPNDQDELTLTVLTGDASAQSRTFYNTNGKVVGRSSTSSSGAVTMREAVAAAPEDLRRQQNTHCRVQRG